MSANTLSSRRPHFGSLFEPAELLETYDVIGEHTPGNTLTLVIHRANGETVEVPVTSRLDTFEEVSIYSAGGVLQRFAKDFLEAEAN